jgi:hypothetical protein
MKMQSGAILWTALMLLMAAGCFEWTEDSQGNLKSLGVPGIPLWKASPTPALAENGSAPLNDTDPLQLDATSSGAPPDWLVELNRIRTNSGLPEVGQNISLSNACADHARYLVENGPDEPGAFRQYTAALGPAAHTEDPSSKFYSADGAEGANGGRLSPAVFRAADVAFSQNPVADIDGLFAAPFHRLSLIAPWATVAGYGSYGTFPMRAGALDLRGGYSRKVELVEYPGDGALITDGSFYFPEYPSVLDSCSGYTLPVGLPITVQAGRNHVLQLKSFSLSGAGGAVEACGFDPFTYHSPDPGEVQHVQKQLGMFGAIVIVPRRPLADGPYTVSVTTETQTLVWNFSVKNARAISRERVSSWQPGSQ